MDDYKKAALNNFFSERGLKYSFNTNSSQKYKLVIINDIPIYARLANTSELISKGLMGVQKLAYNEGCLLCFGNSVMASLWMKNCRINLQAATIDDNQTIIDILDMKYLNSNYIYRSSSPVSYVLEMPESFFTKHGIRAGNKVKL